MMGDLLVTCPYCGDGMESIGTFHHIECVAALEAELAAERSFTAFCLTERMYPTKRAREIWAKRITT